MNEPNQPLLPDAQRLLASLPYAILLLDPGASIVMANPAAEQFLGQGARRLTKRQLPDFIRFADGRFEQLFGEDDTAVTARDIAITVKGQGARRIDMTMTPLVDHPGWQLLTIHEVGASELLGDPLGMGDLTSLRAPDIMAHEIKNPLAGIRGAAQLLGRNRTGKEKSLTDLITSEVDRIAALIDDMQRLSRKTVAPVSECNLHEAIRRATAVIEAAGRASNMPVRIIEEFDPSLPPVLGNGDALVQVLINLVANATEACEGSQDPCVTIRTRFASGLQLNRLDGTAHVRLPIELRVSDNGPGVAADLCDHIFEPFVTSKQSGQGLGLALVHKLVRDMNGRIGHERDELRGITHFRINLPQYVKGATTP